MCQDGPHNMVCLQVTLTVGLCLRGRRRVQRSAWEHGCFSLLWQPACVHSRRAWLVQLCWVHLRRVLASPPADCHLPHNHHQFTCYLLFPSRAVAAVCVSVSPEVGWLVGWLEFNVPLGPFQQKYGYIGNEIEQTITFQLIHTHRSSRIFQYCNVVYVPLASVLMAHR